MYYTVFIRFMRLLHYLGHHSPSYKVYSSASGFLFPFTEHVCPLVWSFYIQYIMFILLFWVADMCISVCKCIGLKEEEKIDKTGVEIWSKLFLYSLIPYALEVIWCIAKSLTGWPCFSVLCVCVCVCSNPL